MKKRATDPNLQNIPIRADIGRQLRASLVGPPASVLLSADYAKIEFRILMPSDWSDYTPDRGPQ